MHYVGHTHAGVYRPGAKNHWAKSGYEYSHEKTERQMWKNSTFLYWTTCGVAQNRTDKQEMSEDARIWREFHDIVEKYGFKDWHDFDTYMQHGSIEQEIKDWFIAHKDADNPEEAAWFIWYFIFLHPEENIDKTSSVKYDRYTWDYAIKFQSVE